jgi:hypothetical protein
MFPALSWSCYLQNVYDEYKEYMNRIDGIHGNEFKKGFMKKKLKY